MGPPPPRGPAGSAPAQQAGGKPDRALSHGDGHLGRSEEGLVKGRPGGLLLAQLLLQPLEKLLGRFPSAQLAQAAQQAVVQGGLQQKRGRRMGFGGGCGPRRKGQR